MSPTRLPRLRAAMAATFGFALLAGGALPAAAQSAAPQVIATLNGQPITEADLAIAAGEFGDQLNQIPADQRAQALLDLIINIRLASAAAIAEGLDKSPQVQQRIELLRDRTLYSEFLRKVFATAVTEEAARKRFDEELAKFTPQDQVRASHILVKTEDEAKAIIVDLDKGGDFAAIAKEKSIDPGSGANGGDLGFFGKGMMVPSFEAAAFALPVGTYSKTPVQSDFGYHVILVTETRKEPPPAFEAEAQRIQQELIRESFDKEITALRDAAKIEIVPPPAPAAAPASPPAATPATPAAPAGAPK